eukprot:6214485-Pleurochrysis_carterae.AAC.2
MDGKHPRHKRPERRVCRSIGYGDRNSKTCQCTHHDENVMKLGVQRSRHRLMNNIDRVKMMRRLHLASPHTLVVIALHAFPVVKLS